MKRCALILSMLCAACVAMASDQVVVVKANPTNAALSVTATAQAFTGYINELSVSTAAGVTGNVSIAVSAYGGSALVLATNTVTGYMVWKPRIMECAITGDTSLTVTNGVDGDEFMMAGESLTATIDTASATGAVFKVRIKYAK
jgi:hypothetical protein